MVTWWEGKAGIGPATMTSGPFHSHWFVKWLGGTNFVYGKVSSIDLPALGAPTPKFLTYVPAGTAIGSVSGNEVTMSVPLAAVGGLTAGDKIDHVAAFALVERSDVTLNDWADQAKAFSYRIGTAAARQHLSDGYVEVSLDPSFASSTLATLSSSNDTWTAAITGAPSSGTVYARQVLSSDLYTPVWDDVQAGPVAQRRFLSADLSVTKTASPSPVNAGQQLTYTVTVHNAGADPATGTVLTDVLPAGVAFGSATPSQGTCSGTSTVTCQLGTVGAGTNATLTIVVTPSTAAIGTITNSAAVTSATLDPDTANNATTLQTTVRGAADLEVAQQADQSTAHLGQPVTYTITVTNHGPLGANGLTLTDTFTKNAGYAGFSSVRGSWNCTAKPAKRLLTCTLSSLSAGDYAVVQFVVKPSIKGTLGNTAGVTATSPDDPVPANNSSTLEIPVVP
jgi:uncharacterized repeat protein (TIGR01451 family)